MARENYNFDTDKRVIDIPEKNTYYREIYKVEKFIDKITETYSRIRSKHKEITFFQNKHARENWTCQRKLHIREKTKVARENYKCQTKSDTKN